MVDVGLVKPSNQILVSGEPLIQILKTEGTMTYMIPGYLVIQGTNDDDCLIAGVWALNSMAIGWLGYEHTAEANRPADRDTAYLVNKQVAVLNGGGFVLVGRLQASQGTLKKGDALVMGTNGCVAKATAATATIAAGTTTLKSVTNVGPIAMGGGIHAQGPIVGFAEETVADIASIADIMVRSII